MPGQLVGVVGPNGCGKSNIIDAVRWVLGESKASALRGESMQDVIFNGSGRRKPVGRASVELVFDKRSAGPPASGRSTPRSRSSACSTRNGDSSYYINNLHVRRRDIIDLFLGTGLGPRAYAIIEQGMISRIIEAKPEDLRVFLEEAAGVTKYKERRRKPRTACRTRAKTWRASRTSATNWRARSTTWKRRPRWPGSTMRCRPTGASARTCCGCSKRNDARGERERAAREVERAANKLEAETASLRELERVDRGARSEHFAAGDAAACRAERDVRRQRGSRAAGTASCSHLRESRQRLETRLPSWRPSGEHWQDAVRRASERDEMRWKDLLENARERLARRNRATKRRRSRLPQAEQALRDAEAARAVVRRELAQAEQQLRVEEPHRATPSAPSKPWRSGALGSMQDRRDLVAPDPHAIDRLQPPRKG